MKPSFEGGRYPAPLGVVEARKRIPTLQRVGEVNEAPEEGLHPGDQVNMALILASFVRAGVRVIITTHSDWLLKAIANLMRLGELKQKGERGEPGDIHANWLLPEEVGVWWFQKDGVVQPIPFTRDEGIEPADYEDVADALYNRSVHLQDLLEAADRQA